MKLIKPKFWDLSKPSFVSYLLLPLTNILKLNNYIINKKPKKKFNSIKTICVGNIYVGGTGKTTTVIKLYEILKKLKFNVVTAKKFYSSQKDEIILLKKKTKFIFSNSRIDIVKKAIKHRNKILLFDDGLQDKYIDYDLKIVCFDGNNSIGNGQLIPSGPLREKIDSLKKYDAVFVKDNNNSNLIKSIRKIKPKIKIFRTNYKINNLKKFDLKKKYLIFSGIGNPDNFKAILLKNNFKIINEIIYPDHYSYQDKEISDIKKKAKKINAKIITTQKDFVKISKQNQKGINFLDIDLKITKKKELIKFLKLKINE